MEDRCILVRAVLGIPNEPPLATALNPGPEARAEDLWC